MDNNATTLIPARAFARDLNILLKAVRLYGVEHDRTAALFKAAWDTLQAALQGAGEHGLLLGVSRGKVLLDGAPLEPKPTDQSFVQLLSSAGLSSLHFFPAATVEDFSRFVGAFASGGSRGSVIAQVKASLANQSSIRINEVRFVAQDAALPDAGLAAQLTAQALGAEAEKLRDWLKDPQKLLQLIAAAEGARGGPAESSSTSPENQPVTAAAEEEDVLKVFGLLCQIGEAGGQPEAHAQPGQFNEKTRELPAAAQLTLTEALASLAAASPTARPDRPLLVQLAEHIAIRFALNRYERGDTRINAVVEMLDRLKREIKALRKILAAHEREMGRAGLEVESHADVLDRQFWAALPVTAKEKILNSPEAWAIPPRNVRQFVEELLSRGQTEGAGAVLLNYVVSVHNPEREVRRKTSLGLADLTDLYSRTSELVFGFAIRHVGEQLDREPEQELRALLSASFVRFNHEANAQRQYKGVQQALAAMENIEKFQPALADNLWPKIRAGTRLHEFIEDALRAPGVPGELVGVIRRMPQVAVEHLVSRLNRCTRQDERDRLVELARGTGAEGVAYLRRTLATRPAPEAAPTVALLSQLDTGAIEEILPDRVRDWDPGYQDLVVRQLSTSGAPARGKLLLRLVDALDSVVLPETLDEIGMAGDRSASSKLVRMLEEELDRPGGSYLCIKAIEALGRLREPSASPLLRLLLEAKRAWRWQHPRELRITVVQAMQKIDPEWAKRFLPTSGLTLAELLLAPLDPVTATPWLRQRRYERITLSRALSGVVNTPQGDFEIAIQQASLGGGVAQSRRYLKPGTFTAVQFRSGWHRVQVQVLMREARPQRLTFELVSIGLEDRARLRRSLARVHL